MKKILVVFYSRSGATRKMAENLSEKLKANGFEVSLEELLDQKQRKGFWASLVACYDAYKKKLTELARVKEEKVGSYDLVVIGSPLWANTMVPAVRTFLNTYATKMKKVAFFCTSGGNKNSGIFQEMQELSKLPLASLGCQRREVMKDTASYLEAMGLFCQEVEKGI